MKKFIYFIAIPSFFMILNSCRRVRMYSTHRGWIWDQPEFVGIYKWRFILKMTIIPIALIYIFVRWRKNKHSKK